MTYPNDFSQEARTRVEIEETRAGQKFDEARGALPWTSYGPGPELAQLVREYVLRVFVVFVQEACELGRRRIWDLARVKKESLEFLSQLTSKAQSEKAFDFGGRAHRGAKRRLPDMICHVTGKIVSEVMDTYRASAEWRRYQDLLLGVGEAWAAEPENPRPTVARQTGLADELGPGPTVGSSGANETAEVQSAEERRAQRRAVVLPILSQKRWKPSKLAVRAGVDPHCVYGYLAGERTPTEENLRAIAGALGLELEELPE